MTSGFIQRFRGKIEAVIVYIGSGDLIRTSYDGLIAHAGGGQASAVALNRGFNRIATCATLNDSVALPAAVKGSQVYVANDGAAAAKVYAENGSSDTIDGTAGATGVVLTNAKRAIFICLTNGKWTSFGTGETA